MYTPTVLESIITPFPKSMIEWVLDTLGPQVQVVASRLTEDGIELVLEGEVKQVSEVIYVLGQGVK